MLMLQNTDAWRKAKVGKLSASKFADAMARTRNGWGASRARYIGELVSERLTGMLFKRYQSDDMRRGSELEPEARDAYEFHCDAEVVQVGFIDHPTVAMSGCSPDGLVGDHGLVEIKCPAVHTHIETLLAETINAAYLAQMMWQIACTGRQWCDFVSYEPRLPARMQLYVHRVQRDDNIIRMMEREAVTFLQEVDDQLQQLAAMYGPLQLAA